MMGADPARNGDLLYGGYTLQPGAGESYLNDTWLLTQSVSYPWVELTPPGHPPPLANASMTFDPAINATVLFGGDNGSGIHGQTWEYEDGNWTRVQGSALGVPPSPRTLAGMAYDNTTRQVILFGGLGPSGPLGGTYAFSAGTGWTRLSLSPSPSPRYGAGLCPGGNGTLVLFGGRNDTAILGDTWTFFQGHWTLSATTGPPPRWEAGMAFTVPGGYPILFGGIGQQVYNDTWAYRILTPLGSHPSAATPAIPLWEWGAPGIVVVVAVLVGAFWLRRTKGSEARLAPRRP